MLAGNMLEEWGLAGNISEEWGAGWKHVRAMGADC